MQAFLTTGARAGIYVNGLKLRDTDDQEIRQYVGVYIGDTFTVSGPHAENCAYFKFKCQFEYGLSAQIRGEYTKIEKCGRQCHPPHI